MEQKRGQLTDRIQKKYIELTGSEICVVELRLMAYIQYVLTNSQKLDPQTMNKDDRDILKKWKEAGYLEGGLERMSVTKEFWDIISEIIYLGYVDTD